MQMWQTATVQDATGRDYTYPNGDHDKPFLTLTGQAQQDPASWATPQSGGRASLWPSLR